MRYMFTDKAKSMFLDRILPYKRDKKHQNMIHVKYDAIKLDLRHQTVDFSYKGNVLATLEIPSRMTKDDTLTLAYLDGRFQITLSE